MSRRAAISKIARTQYFENVTPLWVTPGRAAIDPKYHDAIHSLVEWIGPSWTETESHFFKIRHTLIATCDAWTRYDWDRDAAWIAERKRDTKNLPALRSSWKRFADAFDKAPFRRRRKMLGLALLGEVAPEAETELTNKEFVDGVNRALDWFGRNLELDDRTYARFGTIEYAGLPAKLPRQEVALALSLADQISFWRNDGLQIGTFDCPHRPSLSKNLPWKSIAQFALANSPDSGSIDVTNVQTLVTSLSKKVALIHWRGENA